MGSVPGALLAEDGHRVSPARAGDVVETRVTVREYASAERFLSGNKDRYVRNADVQHRWIDGEDRFWYLHRRADGGKRFVVVDARSGTSTPAFDHRRVAAGLAAALGHPIEADQLPFSSFRYTGAPPDIQFLLDGSLWTCVLTAPACRRSEPALHPDEVLSPDGRWAAFSKDHNLWIRSTADRQDFQLTQDGVADHAYAGSPGFSGHAVTDVRHPRSTPPQILWSPDSRLLLTHRLDERLVQEAFLVQSVPEDESIRPRLYSYRYPLAGDEHVPLLEHAVYDVVTRRNQSFRGGPVVCFARTLIEQHNVWWSADGRKIYYLDKDRYSKTAALYEVEPDTGVSRQMVRESVDTAIRMGNEKNAFGDEAAVAVLSNGSVLWLSQRDGWAHLYYYSATGALLNQVTSGQWVVRSIVRVDEEAKRVNFMASGREPGRDPYEQYLYAIHFDGSGLELLTPEEGHHEVPNARAPEAAGDPLWSDRQKGRFSRSGRYFVDSFSRPDLPPAFTVRTADGRLVARVERADISKLREGGYAPVEPFAVRAADGETPIYGNLFRPSNFDARRKYPVIDAIYPGPHTIRSAKSFTAAVFDSLEAQSLAELGFIVVTLDGRGTAYRSKVFADHSYGRMAQASDLRDHVAGLRQLAERYPYIDLGRVGVDGVSAGGYAAARAILMYPDFYKVAVAAEGGQDQRGNVSYWGETYLGPLTHADYEGASNLPLAGNLQGKLLLMHGEMDDNVSPSLTLKLVDRLIKANRDFDLLMIPNANHGAFVTSGYFIRRKWDYFVRNLLGQEPPANYSIESLQ